jgi:hypothetical protein
MCILPQFRCHRPPIESNSDLASSLQTVFRDPALYKLLPQSESHVHILSLGSFIQRIRQVQGTFCNKFIFYSDGLLVPCPTPKLEDHPLSFVRGCLFNISAATFHGWRSFLRPQPEDAPCNSDNEPTKHGTSPDWKTHNQFDHILVDR